MERSAHRGRAGLPAMVQRQGDDTEGEGEKRGKSERKGRMSMGGGRRAGG